MLWIDPDRVTFNGAPLPGVTAIALSRAAERTTIEWTDNGPHPTFADAPEQRTTIRITRTIAPGEPLTLKPGDAAALTFRAAPSLAHAGASSVSASLVITAIAHAADPKRPLTQTIDAIALSADGAADPITHTPLTA